VRAQGARRAHAPPLRAGARARAAAVTHGEVGGRELVLGPAAEVLAQQLGDGRVGQREAAAARVERGPGGGVAGGGGGAAGRGAQRGPQRFAQRLARLGQLQLQARRRRAAGSGGERRGSVRHALRERLRGSRHH
jgi:hypothetical protein